MATLLKWGKIMKNYLEDVKTKRVNNDGDCYITSVEIYEAEVGEGKSENRISIGYANGETDADIVCSPNNVQRIEERLYHQVVRGGANDVKLVKRHVSGVIKSFSIGVGSSIASAALLNCSATTANPIVIGGVSGTLALVGGVVAALNWKHYRGLLDEKDSYKIRLKQAPMALDYFQGSPNAWRALDGKDNKEKIERYNNLLELSNNGFNPCSLFAGETGIGLTNLEISRLVQRARREERLGLEFSAINSETSQKHRK